MLTQELTLLMVLALWVGTVHTLLGPDHYIPFIAMAKARRWSLTKTAVVTVLCGLGHVGSSVVLGVVGIALGLAVSHVKGAESWRGNVAGY